MWQILSVSGRPRPRVTWLLNNQSLASKYSQDLVTEDSTLRQRPDNVAAGLTVWSLQWNWLIWACSLHPLSSWGHSASHYPASPGPASATARWPALTTARCSPAPPPTPTSAARPQLPPYSSLNVSDREFLFLFETVETLIQSNFIYDMNPATSKSSKLSPAQIVAPFNHRIFSRQTKSWFNIFCCLCKHSPIIYFWFWDSHCSNQKHINNVWNIMVSCLTLLSNFCNKWNFLLHFGWFNIDLERYQ